MIKLFGSDVDHTLYCAKLQTIPEKTVKAIKKLTAKGVVVAICSSRNFDGIMSTVEQLDLKNTNGYVVANNGAYVVRLKDNKVLVDETFSKEEVALLYEKSKEYGLGFGYMMDANYHVTTAYCEICDYNHKNVDLDILITSNPLGFVKDDSKVRQVNFFDDNANMYELYDKIEPSLKEKYNFNVPQKTCMDTALKHVNKFTGLQAVMRDLGITEAETATAGDNDNDAPMLKGAGVSCCVANGSENAKKAATYIVDDVEVGGVADFIEKYLL